MTKRESELKALDVKIANKEAAALDMARKEYRELQEAIDRRLCFPADAVPLDLLEADRIMTNYADLIEAKIEALECDLDGLQPLTDPADQAAKALEIADRLGLEVTPAGTYAVAGRWITGPDLYEYIIDILGNNAV